MSAFVAPTCGKCGHRHYNFLGCKDAEKQRRQPDWEKPPRNPEGFSEWGHKLDAYNEAGGTLWLKEPRSFFTGKPVHFPDDEAA